MSGFSVSSAERCLAILELLADKPDGLPLTTIVGELGLPLSAAHRLLSMLVARDYLVQREGSGWYAPTITLALLGLRLLEASGLSDLCQPVLDGLAQRCGELVRLAVVQNARLSWIAKAQGSRSNLRYDPITGRDVPLHVTAMGKAWLAELPEDEAVALVLARGFRSELLGPRAVRDEAGLRRELSRTRSRGFGLVQEEAEAGVSAIAAVVREGGGPGASPVAAVSIAGPTFRLDEDKLVAMGPMLLDAAAELSRLWAARRYHAARLAQVASEPRAAG